MWNLAIRHPVFITMCVLAVVVIGIAFFLQTGLDLFPDISVPVVAVQTVYPGASAEDVERDVSRPLEDAFSTLNGVESVRSTSQEGVSTLVVEFSMEHPSRDALQDVRERLAAVRRTLPEGVEEPVLQRFDPASLPIITLGVTDTRQVRSLADLRKLAEDKLKPRLERAPGVAAATVSGGREREVLVSLDATRIAAYNVPVEQVVRAIQTHNLSVPAGRVTQGQREWVLRTSNEFRSVDALRNLVVAGGIEGTPVRLSDVAQVREGLKEVRTFSRLNGKESVGVLIYKQSGTNTIQVADAVFRELDRLGSEHPDLDIRVAFDQSNMARVITSDLFRHLALGGLAAILVVFLFFRDWRNTFVTVVGLPIVIVGTFGAIYLLGFTLNIITLLALTLTVGLLIDDAIVVRENIFRHMEAGKDPRTAASEATGEIARAVVATTLVIVAVFFPIAFVKGLVGRFFNQFGLVVSVAVLLSLVEALALAPMLSAHLFRPRREEGARREGRVLAAWGHAYTGGEGLYRRLLRWSLGHRWTVLGAGVGSFALALALVPAMGQELAPQVDRGFFNVSLEMPPGTALSETDAAARRVEAALNTVPEVMSVFTTVGTGTAGAGGGPAEPEKAVFFVRTPIGKTAAAMDWTRGALAAAPELARARMVVSSLTESSLGAAGGSFASFGTTVAQVAVRGNDSGELARTAEAVMERLRQSGGFTDVDSSLRMGKPELRVRVDPDRASELGVSPASVALALRSLVSGDAISRFRREGEDDIDITVRLREEDRQREDALLSIPVATATGSTARVGSVAAIAPATGPGRIDRENRERQVIISANYGKRALSDALRDLERALRNVPVPAGVGVFPVGQAKQFQETFTSLLVALLLAVAFMYMVLASEFGSFTHPLVIMAALPLAGIGALGALLLTGFPLSMMSMIGVILLMGLVAKNSILLVDFTNVLRGRGLSRTEALLTAGPIRLRPILMTTATMIVGMLPVALGLGAGTETRQPMGIAVVGGLVTSTLLTLVVVPVAYTFMDDIVERVRRGRVPGPAPVAPERPSERVGTPGSRR